MLKKVLIFFCITAVSIHCSSAIYNEKKFKQQPRPIDLNNDIKILCEFLKSTGLPSREQQWRIASLIRKTNALNVTQNIESKTVLQIISHAMPQCNAKKDKTLFDALATELVTPFVEQFNQSVSETKANNPAWFEKNENVSALKHSILHFVLVTATRFCKKNIQPKSLQRKQKNKPLNLYLRGEIQDALDEHAASKSDALFFEDDVVEQRREKAKQKNSKVKARHKARFKLVVRELEFKALLDEYAIYPVDDTQDSELEQEDSQEETFYDEDCSQDSSTLGESRESDDDYVNDFLDELDGVENQEEMDSDSFEEQSNLEESNPINDQKIVVRGCSPVYSHEPTEYDYYKARGSAKHSS